MSTGKSLPANYLKDYLKVAPISHSVWRAAEAKELSKIDLPPPTLDVGCGFGEFAGVFFDSMIEVGIDISLPDVSSVSMPGRCPLEVIVSPLFYQFRF